MNKPLMLCIGAAVQDVFLSNSDSFAPVCVDPEHCFAQLEMGAKADVNAVEFSTGGGAMNAATTFARQGLETTFIGKIGHDPAGEAVLADLDRESINAKHMVYSKKYNTGYSVILLAPSGERTILTYRGASTHYRVENFQNVKKIKTDWLVLSTLSGNFEVLEFLLKWAKENHVKVAFNPGKKELEDAQRLADLLPYLEILSLNKEEAQLFVEGNTTKELAIELSESVPYVLVSDGPKGAVAAHEDTVVSAGLYEDVPVLDRTGAGDSFTSGFVSQIALGNSLETAITFASANSTSVVTKIGAKAGILSSADQVHEMPLVVEKISSEK
jgi:sugar/nucleoside kinase (ribokinase family)